MILVSVHIPKTGGSTFRAVLKQHFAKHLLLDYNDHPMTHTTFVRSLKASVGACHLTKLDPQVKCVHGHFLPLKYRRLATASFAVWLRHPVERVISRYHYYQKTFRPDDPDTHHKKYIRDHAISLEDFCRIPQYHNLYAKYLFGFPLKRFDFVGITENYTSSLELFQEIFQIPVPENLTAVNRNPEKKGNAYAVDQHIRDLIIKTNQKDMRLYEQALLINQCLIEDHLHNRVTM